MKNVLCNAMYCMELLYVHVRIRHDEAAARATFIIELGLSFREAKQKVVHALSSRHTSGVSSPGFLDMAPFSKDTVLIMCSHGRIRF